MLALKTFVFPIQVNFCSFWLITTSMMTVGPTLMETWIQTTWILCLYTLHPDSGTLISKWNEKITFTWKEKFWQQILFLVFLDMFVRDNSWFTDFTLCHLTRMKSLDWMNVISVYQPGIYGVAGTYWTYREGSGCHYHLLTWLINGRSGRNIISHG